jgi:hypothetical protein
MTTLAQLLDRFRSDDDCYASSPKLRAGDYARGGVHTANLDSF